MMTNESPVQGAGFGHAPPWGMTKLYVKSQLLQANMFKKKLFYFCKKNLIKSGSGGGGATFPNMVEWVGQVSLDDAPLT